MRYKSNKFCFSFPIPRINNSGGIFTVESVGELIITGTAKIENTLGDLPLQFADDGEVRIELEKVDFQGVDILPIIQLPACKPMLYSLNRAALNQVHTILKDLKDRQ